MNTAMLKRVRRHYNSPFVPDSTNRANRLKWVRSVRLLGDKWLLAVPVQRQAEPDDIAAYQAIVQRNRAVLDDFTRAVRAIKQAHGIAPP